MNILGIANVKGPKSSRNSKEASGPEQSELMWKYTKESGQRGNGIGRDP